MFFVIIILFFLLISSVFLSNFTFGRFVIFLVSLCLLYAVFLLITYTPDKEFYTVWINLPNISVDKEPTFQIVVAYIRKYNHSYQFLHITFISVYSLIFLYFVNKFAKNVFVVVLLYIPLIFIFYSTQLRYFLGYYSTLIGFYHLTVSKNRKLALLWFVFGIASHYSLVLFLPVYFLLQINKKFFSKMVQLMLLVFFGYAIFTTILFQLFSGIRFVDYLKGDLVSSYLGGLFSFGVLIPVYIFVNIYYKDRLKINPELSHDIKFNFLYKMSLIPMIYIGVSLFVQVIGHRIIMTGMLFPILLFFYKISEVNNLRCRIRYYFYFFIFIVLIFIHFNFSTGLVFGEWEMVEEMGKMINSNVFLKYLLN